jgi:hypothetical protein
MLPDILPLIIKHLDSDALASIRLLRSSRQLWLAYGSDKNYWRRMEALLPHQSRYHVFKLIHEHLGIRRRVMAWASYCDSRCSKCGLVLFGICTGTFAVQMKLCYKCKCEALVSERELMLYAPYALNLVQQHKLRWCWVPYAPNDPVRHWERQEVLSLIYSTRPTPTMRHWKRRDVMLLLNSASRVDWVP